VPHRYKGVLHPEFKNRAIFITFSFFLFAVKVHQQKVFKSDQIVWGLISRMKRS